MTDLELLITGAMVTFIAVAGAYIAIRHRANETPVRSFKPEESIPEPIPAVIRPRIEPR